MTSKSKLVLVLALVVMMVLPLVGCGEKPAAKPTAAATDGTSVEASVEPGGEDEGGEIVEPEVSLEPGATLDPNATAAPQASAVADKTGAKATGKSSKTTAKKTAKPKATKVTPVYTGPYKGVLLMGHNAKKMSPFSYTNNTGSMYENGWFHDTSIYDDTTPKKKKGCKYFTLLFADPADKITRTAYEKACAGGHIPAVLNLDINKRLKESTANGRYPNLAWAMPYINNGTTQKVYFDLWMWDIKMEYKGEYAFSVSDKDMKSKKLDDATLDKLAKSTDGWLEDCICADIKKIADEFKKKNSKVQIYVGGYIPYTKDYPRYSDPENFYGMGDHTDIEGKNMNAMDSAAYHKQHNSVLRKFCEKNGYTFVDYYDSAAGLVGPDNYLKTEYAQEHTHGAVFSAAGLKAYGNYLMKKMGLPIPTPEY